jgi:hypothetical protein
MTYFSGSLPSTNFTQLLLTSTTITNNTMTHKIAFIINTIILLLPKFGLVRDLNPGPLAP